MRCKRRVIAAAVLHVQHKREIEHRGFQRRIFHVRPQDAQKVGCRGQAVRRIMDIHAAAAFVMVVCVVRINSQHREHRNQHQTLAQHIRQADIVRAVVVGSKCQYAAGQAVHHISCRRFHDHVTRKVGRQRAPLGEQVFEFTQPLCVRQFAEQKQISNFLISPAAVFHKTLHQIIDPDPTVIQLTIARNQLTVHFFFGDDIRNIGQPRQYTFTIQVSQAAFDVV